MFEFQRENSVELYDPMLRQVERRSLQNYVCLQSKATLKRHYTHGRWLDPPKFYGLQMSGIFERYPQIKKLENQTRAAFKKGSPHFKFDFLVRKGDMFPTIEGRINPFQRNISNLTHVQGQVLVIMPIQKWNPLTQELLQKFEEALLTNESAWKNKVRIVAINRANWSPSKMIGKNGSNITWKLVQHLQLQEKSFDFIQELRLCQEEWPYVVILNKQGTIEFADYYHFSNKIEDDIVQVLGKNTQEGSGHYKSAQDQQKKVVKGDPRNWNKITQIIKKVELPQSLINGIDIYFEGSITKKYRYGQFFEQTEPLKISYTYVNDNLGDLSNWLKDLTKNLCIQQYTIEGLVNNPETCFTIYYEKLVNLLSQNGIQKQPRRIQLTTYDLIKGVNWSVQQKLQYPKLTYKQDCTFQQGTNIRRGIWNSFGKARFCQELFNTPWQVINSEFSGISGLYCVNNRPVNSISPVKDRGLIILKWTSEPKPQDISSLGELVQGYSEKAQVHIVAVSSALSSLDFVADKVFIYLRQDDRDLKAMNLVKDKSHFYLKSLFPENQNYINILIVNTEGIITKVDVWSKTCNNKIHQWLRPKRIVQKSLVQTIQEFPKNQLIRNLRQVFIHQNYPTKFRLEYVTQVRDLVRIIQSAKVKIITTDQHHEQLQPLLNMLQSQGTEIDATYIQTLSIPNGKECFECHDTLTLPYYYFPWSKVIRCIECAEVQDAYQSQKMKRYPIQENSILVFAYNTRVNVELIGKNVQPQTEIRASSRYDVYCEICQQSSRCQVQYSCVECYSQRRPLLCLGCVKKIRGTVQQKRQIQSLCPEGHRYEHALLRTLYPFRDY